MPPKDGETTKKRAHPTSSSSQPTPGRNPKRQKLFEQRNISTQTTENAFNGEINLASFVKAREFEIRALENGIKSAKGALMRRAFQEVPRELRRRQASHNVKRVPKRLQKKAAREMAEDNTPTVNSKTRSKNAKMRLRLDTANRLQRLHQAQKKKTVEEKAGRGKDAQGTGQAKEKDATQQHISKKAAKLAKLSDPLVPATKFRKRQIEKTWLPTHMYHTKRARMSEPKEPLWRFAIPITPSTKCYRPTHRATSLRSAVAWDMSYMSTIGLAGREKSIKGVLNGLGFGSEASATDPWGKKGLKWRQGLRTWDGWLFERRLSDEQQPICPATVIWRQEQRSEATEHEPANSRRKAFIRIYPAGFLQLWEQIVRLAKVQKPEVSVEDLRFEIGSIEVTGPASTEALVSVLWPNGTDKSQVTDCWHRLTALSNPAMLPKDVLFGFDIADPRLHHPPKRSKVASDAIDESQLLDLMTSWPLDSVPHTSALFDRKSRRATCLALPSQKSINRRRSTCKSGLYPEPQPKDPKIPVLLFATRNARKNGQGTWTLMLPWKCVLPVWYSLMYYPVSTGGTLRFGGLQEKQQIAFESGTPSYPGDYPGTKAGDVLEAQARAKRHRDWERRPRGKRVEWTTLDLGTNKKGELGLGWACDWDFLVHSASTPGSNENAVDETATENDGDSGIADDARVIKGTPRQVYIHVAPQKARSLLSQSSPETSSTILPTLFTVKLTTLTRGTLTPCARIYRLPTANTALRSQWLSQLPKSSDPAPPKLKFPTLPPNAPEHVNRARLAHLLLTEHDPSSSAGDHPCVPEEEDLIGFVTTGQFNLAEGRDTAIGSLLLHRLLDGWKGTKESEKYVCIVRESGQKIGRLARWELV